MSLHYDANGIRVAMRRNTVCPDGWIKQIRADGTNQCPEPDQPKWRWKKCIQTGKDGKCNKWQNDDGPQDPVMFQKLDANGVVIEVDNNRLAKKVDQVDINGVQTTKYSKLGAVLSCDEWPAARYAQN